MRSAPRRGADVDLPVENADDDVTTWLGPTVGLVTR